MHRNYKHLLVICLAVVCALPCVGMSSRPDGARPISFSLSPSSLSPGGTSHCTVQLDQAVDSDQDISITSSDSSQFSSLPTTETVTAGHDSVTFDVTVSTSASGYVSLYASANGYTKPALLSVQGR